MLVGTSALIIGNIYIGNNVITRANTAVTKVNVMDNYCAIGISSKIKPGIEES